MAIQINPINSDFKATQIADVAKTSEKAGSGKQAFKDTIGDYVKNVDNEQDASNQSIVNLLTGKTQDINSVIADVARADMSFKMLVGVRNKLVSAYQETMKMQM